MLISYNLLKKYFKESLPKPDELADILNTRAYEVEKVEQIGDDYTIDIDVLPNRSHDSLCHYGISKEIATLTGLTFIYDNPEISFGTDSDRKVDVQEKEACPRYSFVEVKNIEIKESPEELQTALTTLGQRSINNVVDITNIVMLELNQPMHAFDADKVDGDIIVRYAKSGEKITTLDKKEVELDENILVIADKSGPLAIAGVKGGNVAEVDINTKNIILESANFDQTLVRKNSQKIDIKTDSSKRFENGISPILVEKGMKKAVELITKYIPNAQVGAFVDEYSKKYNRPAVEVSLDKIQKLLGVNISENEVEEILEKLDFKYENKGGIFYVTAPEERLDINIREEVVEEIGRVYGYENILEKPIEMEFIPKINKEYHYNNLIRKILYEQGFSEVMTSSFRDKGDLEVLKPANQEVPFLRTNLGENMNNVLEKNFHNIELLGLDHLRVFEIGKVFPRGQEKLMLCLGFAGQKNLFPEPEEILKSLSDDIKIEQENYKNNNNIYNINLDELYEKLPEPTNYTSLLKLELKSAEYKPFSQYPFVLRDIAVWLPDPETSSGRHGGEELLELIKENAGELLVKNRLFDEFSKDGRVSYAYRLVFQSFEKTLTDEEVGEIMTNIESKIADKGWEVR